jgi:hypothetical protein
MYDFLFPLLTESNNEAMDIVINQDMKKNEKKERFHNDNDSILNTSLMNDNDSMFNTSTSVPPGSGSILDGYLSIGQFGRGHSVIHIYYMYVCMYVCICIYESVCIYSFICIHIHTYRYLHMCI